MKITNSEYNIIIRAINTMIHYHKELDSYIKEAKVFKDKLIKEYDKIAEKNATGGMTSEEEEIYPSITNTEYGGSSIGDKKVE
jgi:hypothetical protein